MSPRSSSPPHFSPPGSGSSPQHRPGHRFGPRPLPCPAVGQHRLLRALATGDGFQGDVRYDTSGFLSRSVPLAPILETAGRTSLRFLQPMVVALGSHEPLGFQCNRYARRFAGDPPSTPFLRAPGDRPRSACGVDHAVAGIVDCRNRIRRYLPDRGVRLGHRAPFRAEPGCGPSAAGSDRRRGIRWRSDRRSGWPNCPEPCGPSDSGHGHCKR